MEIDEFHRHELLDRIHCIRDTFHNLVVDHTAASLLEKEIKKAADILSDLYQKAGNVRWNTK